jgi:Transposase IS200 like
MDEHKSLSHTKWECKYHVVFIPKCRRKTLYGELRRHLLGEVFRKLAVQKQIRIEEGHLMPDHHHNPDAIRSAIYDLLCHSAVSLGYRADRSPPALAV